MRVLLINPWKGECFPPPSIGYLQAVGKNYAEITARDYSEAMLLRDDFDLVGVTFHSFSVKYAKSIRDKFKGRLICGGHHPTALPEQMLSIGYDQVVIGEGENAFIDILKGNKNKIIHGKETDIETLPFPDYTGLKGERIMGMPVISSRGCPFKCSFCASADFWKRKWRMRTPENVVSEIKSIGKEFMFEDDNFTLKKDRAINICEKLGTGYKWQCASRAESLQDAELCRALAKAGCHTVWLGIETLSQESLDRCNKATTVEKMLNGIATAESNGLNTMSQFIVGLPDETEKDILETVRNIKRSRIRRKGLQILWILPNTEIHKRAKVKGFNDNVYLSTGAPLYTYEQNLQTLNRWSNLIRTA